MKRIYISCLIAAIVLMLFFFVLILHSVNTPPDVHAVQNGFDENKDDFLLITSYLKNSQFDDIYISDSSGQVIADRSSSHISNEEVFHAILNLFESDTCVQINKMDTTINFLLWVGVHDIGCGIVYSENINESIEREWLTEVIPLEAENWFYYISDYNAWRRGERATIKGS